MLFYLLLFVLDIVLYAKRVHKKNIISFWLWYAPSSYQIVLLSALREYCILDKLQNLIGASVDLYGFLSYYINSYLQQLCLDITEQEWVRKRKRRKAVKSNYLPGNKALSNASHRRSSTVLSVFLTIARTISSASFFYCFPTKKRKKDWLNDF